MRNRILRTFGIWSPTREQRTLVVTLLTGGACGLVAVAFHASLEFAEQHLIGAAERAAGHSWIVFTLLCPMLGGLIAGFALTHLFPAATGSGIPQVKAAYALQQTRLRMRDGTAKFGLTVLQIGTGASLGREGPTVHICAALAGALGRWFALPASSVRRLLPVGAAAGVAAAFNAPIAAVTFAVEEIIGTLDQTLLSGIVVAAALAAVIEHMWLGTNPVLATPIRLGFTHLASLPLYAVLGCCAGLISILFTRSLMGLRATSKNHRAVPDWVKPGIGGLLTGMCAVIGLLTVGSHGVAGGGYAELSQALAGVLPITTLLALCVLKLGATVFSYSSGGTGGLFAPALFIGAMLGGSVGWLGHEILGYSELGEFALVGMGATFAGIIRAPITSVLIVFEMTDGYALVLPLMIATTISYMVAKRAEPHGLYDALLAQDGIQIPHSGQARRQLETLRVMDAMTASLSTLPADASVAEALARVQQEAFKVYPVVDAVSNRCAGLVDMAELRQLAAQGHAQRRLADVASIPAWVRPEDALLRAVVRMNETGARHLLVFEKEDRVLLGLVTRSDILRAQAKTVEEPLTERPPLSRERAI